MKTNKFRMLLVLLTTLLFTCCKEETTSSLLQRMEEIKQKGDSIPTEALAELKQIEPDIKYGTSDYVKYKYLLLNARLKDKAFIVPTSSDTIEDVTDYFDRHGSVEERMEAYYYEASVYRDLKDYPREMTAFHKVLDLAYENRVGDCQLLQNTYSQLSGLYIFQQLYTEALKMAKAGCEMAERTHTLDPIYLMDVASCAWFVQDSATHIEYSLKTLDCIKKDSRKIFPSVVCELLIRFSEHGMKTEMKECFVMLQSSERYKVVHNYLSAIAIYYDFSEQADSAVPYYERILNTSDDKSMKKDAAHRLMDYYIGKQQYEEAAKYAQLYARFVDDVFKEKRYESTSRASGEHLYAISLKKELQAREEADNNKIRIYGMAASFLAAALVIGIIYHKKREHYLKELLRKDEALGAAKEVSIR